MLATLLVACLPAPLLAISDVTIIQPGKTEVLEHQTLIVERDKIASLSDSRAIRIPPGSKVVDGKGKFLMPSLWDMHVHAFDPKCLGLFTANGITGVRIMFGDPSHLLWRSDIEKGKMTGPHIIAGSPIVDGPKPVWPTSIAVGTAEEGREAVRTIKKQGYDFVKVYSLLSREAYFAIADECTKVGIPFAGHIPYSVGLREAAEAGQRTAEHVLGISLDSSSREGEIRPELNAAASGGFAAVMEVFRKRSPEITASFDAAKFDALIKDLARSKMWQCPTLIVLRNTSYLDEVTFDRNPRMKYLPLMVTSGWNPKTDFRLKDRKPEEWAAAKRTYLANEKVVGAMYRAGIPLLAGSDCLNPMTFPGFSLHDELELLVKSGLSPTDALAAATVNPARFLGRDKAVGTVEKGKVADLLLLSANPLQDIRNTTKISAVVQDGKLYDRKALDKLLKAAEYPLPKPPH